MTGQINGCSAHLCAFEEDLIRFRKDLHILKHEWKQNKEAFERLKRENQNLSEIIRDMSDTQSSNQHQQEHCNRLLLSSLLNLNHQMLSLFPGIHQPIGITQASQQDSPPPPPSSFLPIPEETPSFFPFDSDTDFNLFMD